MKKKYQVVGIGNALVDVLTHMDDEFLHAEGIGKGVMQLIGRERARDLYARIGPAIEVSGGSAANTIAGVAKLGGTETPPAPDGGEHETGRCVVIVTPDGERSMNTYLGVTEHLSPSDIDRPDGNRRCHRCGRSLRRGVPLGHHQRP